MHESMRVLARCSLCRKDLHAPVQTCLYEHALLYQTMNGGFLYSHGVAHSISSCMQDHMRGRRHARRLQYIRNMPESERTPFMERVASGETHCICLAINWVLSKIRSCLAAGTPCGSKHHWLNRSSRAGDWHVLHRRDSTGSTGSNGEGISLLRIGSITLPSSMDLRQYLEQMQASTPDCSLSSLILGDSGRGSSSCPAKSYWLFMSTWQALCGLT